MRDAADDEDSPAAAEALVALDVLAAKAKQLRTTVDRRIAAGLRAEQTALNALLAEPEFAGATVSYPELEQGFSPDMALAKDGVVTYVEFKRGRELQRAADNLADYVARHDPAARALLVVVGKPANAALPHIADRVRVRVLKAA
ncbi:MAG: hypothetical protein FJ100_21650 [Deltaproteobacteria bacterium]|nr:hypothetical protein [Deltaproteobacteria bacterium]